MGKTENDMEIYRANNTTTVVMTVSEAANLLRMMISIDTFSVSKSERSMNHVVETHTCETVTNCHSVCFKLKPTIHPE